MILGVNIDHIATLREARKINEPDPLEAVFLAKRAGAGQITIHLREDRRHIHDSDVRRIVDSSFLPVNVECSINQEIVNLLCELKPHQITLVPENRDEVTTEGGLDLSAKQVVLAERIAQFKREEIVVSLFIDPDVESIERAKALGADRVELHTGSFANLYLMRSTNLPRTPHAIDSLKLGRATLEEAYQESLEAIQSAAKMARECGLGVAAGHGLNYQNVREMLRISEIEELNIGHSIIARAVWSGFEGAVREMVEILRERA